MRRPSFLVLNLGLLVLLALGLSSCVRARPSPTALPTGLGHTPTATPARTVTPIVAQAPVATKTPVPTATPIGLAVQPTPTPTPTLIAVTPVPTQPAGGEVSYQVRWGDTLTRIARDHGTTVEAIMAWNPRITDASRLVAGTELVIPSGAAVPPKSAPAAPEVYVVRWGDTLSSIARRFGTTVGALLQANPAITDGDHLVAGQRVALPPGAAPLRRHVVRVGDTLSSLARQYNTTVWAIVAANNLPNANHIYPGQTLLIP